MTLPPDMAFQLASIGLLLLLSAFFSGSETALFSLSRTQARRMRRGTPGERAATRLLAEPQHLLSTLLIGNLLVNILLASQIAGLARRLTGGSGVGIAIGISTALLLVFGEVTPKTVAVRHAHTFARIAGLPLWFFSRLITPLRIAAGITARRFMRVFGLEKAGEWGALTRDELRAMLHIGEAHGATTHRERVIAERILELPSIAARDIMTPRTDLAGVPDHTSLEEAFRTACRQGTDRIFVYRQNLDDVWGFVPVLELAHHHSSSELRKPLAEFRIRSGSAAPGKTISKPAGPVYPVSVFPESVRISRILSEMRNRRTQVAVLVDEFGGTAGMITLDDILAEILGRAPATATPPDAGGAMRVDGRVPIRVLNRRLQPPIPEEEGAETLGGHVAALLGRLPRNGDTAEDGRYRYQVIRMAGRRVKLVEIHPLPAPSSPGAPPNREGKTQC